MSVWPIPAGRGSPMVTWHLYRIIREHGIGVVDLHNPQSQLWGTAAALLARVPERVITMHSLYRESESGRIRPRTYEAVLRLCQQADARVLAVSTTVADYARQIGIPGDRVHVSENGLPLPAPADADRWRRLLAVPPGTSLIVGVGRLTAVKGFDLLIDALARSNPGIRAVQVAIAGDGPERDRLQARIERQGLADRVRLLGFVEDVGGLLAAADLFCMPSRTEGLPYAALEAAQRRVPVVASAIDAITDLFENGRTATLVPPDNPNALARALRWALDHPSDMADQANLAGTMVDRRFSIDAMAESALAVYDRTGPAFVPADRLETTA